MDWQEDATLYVRLPVEGGADVTRARHAGPLHWIVDVALSGRCGPAGILLIETESGEIFEAAAIEEIAQRADRPKPSGDADPAREV